MTRKRLREELYIGMSEEQRAGIEEYNRRKQKKAEGTAAEAAIRAREYAQRKKAREAQRPTAVKEYFVSTKVFREALELAINAAEKGQFAPESFSLVSARRESIEDLLKRLTNTIQRGVAWAGD